MPYALALRRLSFWTALFSVFLSSGKAQAPLPPEAAATIPIEQEHYHQQVFANSYVKAFYVEIPAHDATLYHRHDLPYVSLPPPLANAPTVPAGAPAQQPRVSYNPGGFSHAVTNSGDVALRNVAIELLHPQGAVRNRCQEVVRGQPLNNCDKPTSPDPSVPYHYTLFETDEIVVEYFALPPHSIFTSSPNRDMLAGGLSGVNTNAPTGARANGPFFEPRSGLAWLPSGSTTLFEAAPDAVGHFITIKFKDAKPLP